MIKTNQFNEKAQYVSPSCKSAELSFSGSILVESRPGARWYDGGAGVYGNDEMNDNGEY